MKRIGIVTLLYKNCNYGGLLQAYAIKMQLTKLGFKAEHISCSGDYMQAKFRDKLYEKGLIGVFKSLGVHLKKSLKKYHLIKNYKLKNKLEIKRLKCYEFTKKIGGVGPYNYITIQNCLNKFDIFVTGSDQVWNPNWHKDAYYLNFVPEDVPKLSYAASVGKSELSEKELDDIIPKIKRINKISVRECEAKKILQPYIDQDIKVVLDPTLLLKQEDWNKITIENNVNEQYVFVYLLGSNLKHRKKIKNISTVLGYKILYLPHIHFQYEPADENFADIDLYDVGPAEFVGLIKNAEMVITDSFHGCVFSIIYHKKFWALKRHKDTEKGNMNSRLYTLFSNLGLEERLLDDDQKLTKEELLREIDYEAVDEKLEILRKDSMDFLENALSESVKMIEKNQKKQKSKGN